MKWPWSKVTIYKTTNCAACKGTGARPIPQKLTVPTVTKEFLLVTQGICLSCKGSGVVSVKEREER